MNISTMGTFDISSPLPNHVNIEPFDLPETERHNYELTTVHGRGLFSALCLFIVHLFIDQETPVTKKHGRLRTPLWSEYGERTRCLCLLTRVCLFLGLHLVIMHSFIDQESPATKTPGYQSISDLEHPGSLGRPRRSPPLWSEDGAALGVTRETDNM